jgi:iron(III) transport system permease protein
VVLIVASVASMWVSSLATRNVDYATTQRGGGGIAKRKLRPWESVLAYLLVFVIIALVIAPHIGLLLLSFATIWSFSPLPDGFTVAHYVRVFGESSIFIKNTLLYASLAGLIDIVIGTAISYLVLRTKLVGVRGLDLLASAALAIPGVVLGIGYLRAFYGVTLWNGAPLASVWIVIVIALAIRRLPYALRACYAALQQISASLEEAAENLGAGKASTIRRIVVPLMTGGLVAGFITSFATAAVELSATLMLVQANQDAPLSYGLYVFMQSASGRGPGAALGVIAVVIVALCTVASQYVIERDRRSKAGAHLK